MQQGKEQIEGVGGANVEYEAETVIATVTGVNTGVGHFNVYLEALVQATTNAGTTETTYRIRRESLTGTTVATAVVKPGASTKVNIGLQCLDTVPTEVAGGTYVLTATETAAVKGKSVSSRIAATF